MYTKYNIGTLFESKSNELYCRKPFEATGNIHLLRIWWHEGKPLITILTILKLILIFLKIFIYFETDRERGNLKQAVHSAQSLTRDSIPCTMRSWSEQKSRVGGFTWLSHAGATNSYLLKKERCAQRAEREWIWTFWGKNALSNEENVNIQEIWVTHVLEFLVLFSRLFCRSEITVEIVKI